MYTLFRIPIGLLASRRGGGMVSHSREEYNYSQWELTGEAIPITL